MRTWSRPYHDPMRIFTAGVAVAGTLAFTVLGIMLAVRRPDMSVVQAFALVGFAAVWLTFAWRLHRTALVVSHDAIRIRWLPRTRTIPWSSIKDFQTRQEWVVTRLVVVLRDGTTFRTPIQRRSPPLHGVRITISDGGTVLAPDLYDHLLTHLNARLSAASGGPVKP